ncbi:MAG: glycosyltransferase [Desulfobacterales bacterium]|nr:glycosyltransferase [Desulfobacterales bacterium]
MSHSPENALTAESTPQVSVIIPTFNRAWAVGKAIDSVLFQDYPNFELIVVDDGSIDQTRSLLSAYQSWIVYIHQPNQGVSAARNRGIAAASGDLIAFLDSDDYWLPGKLSEQVAFFNAHPDALICQTEEVWIRNGRRVNPRRRHQKPAGDIFIPSLELCLVSPSAVMAKKALFVEIGGFDENLPACEDYDLWLRVSSQYPVHLIEKPLIVKQGGHADQLSRQPGLDKYRIFAIEKILAGRLLTDEKYSAAVRALKEKCEIYAAGCRKRGKNGEADYYWGLSRQYGPMN